VRRIKTDSDMRYSSLVDLGHKKRPACLVRAAARRGAQMARQAATPDEIENCASVHDRRAHGL
jgi:hypothetical protein